MLDCETPLGKVFMAHQRTVQDYLTKMGYTIVSTPNKDSGSDILISKHINGDLTLCGVAEIKNREYAGSVPLTYDYLLNNGGYLVSYHKIESGSKTSSLLEVPFYLIVNLLLDKKMLIWKITNENGEFEFEFETKRTSSKATCNGGLAVRLNSYLPVLKATKIEF